ncbi:TerC family protein [Helicobacter pylori]|uniref:TerC family protein n=1 Tax=Helicobacter pylori TaxID=210 RepID=UPI00165A3AEC|nr:TerC family protein [Helicobacter pylori]WQS20734.1 TerC family protein [Helicobacter pylori]WQS30076.1 TerC family protein [Helicobacter pylori]
MEFLSSLFSALSNVDGVISLSTLTLLEIILGIDNIIFIMVVVYKLPKHQQNKARILGLSLAMLTRIGLLGSLFFISHLQKPLFILAGMSFSGRDVVLLLGGAFLAFKALMELKEQIYPQGENAPKKAFGFFITLIEIMFLDIVFSLDSVITAIGLAKHLEIMVVAIILAVVAMLFFSKIIGDFIERHYRIKTLAFVFLLFVGASLFLEGLHLHINKNYLYAGIGFALIIECLNIFIEKKIKK